MYNQSDPRTMRRIRLLIVDDDPNTVQGIRRLMSFEQSIHIVGSAAGGREALAKTMQLRPHVVLMDVNLRDMDGLHAAKEILAKMDTRVIMMSVQRDTEYVQKTLRIGASDFLVKPFTSDELLEAIGRLTLPDPPGPRGEDSGPQYMRRIITVYSPKGGAGRSVIAANLAIALHTAHGRRVLLADANLSTGDAHVLLNLTGPTTIEDLREAPGIDQDLIDGTVQRHQPSGISLLRAPLTPEAAGAFDRDTIKPIYLEAREQFDYVVIDAESGYSDIAQAAMEIADNLLVVTTLEVTTINRVGLFLELADRIGLDHAHTFLVCNRVDNHYGIKPNQVEARLRNRFISQIPEDIKLVAASVNQGKPFVLHQKNAPVTRAILNLAMRLDDLNSQTEP